MADSVQESELESFRQEWKYEVSARNRETDIGPSRTASGSSSIQRIPYIPTNTLTLVNPGENKGSYNPGAAYHDLEDKSELLKLRNERIRPQGQPKEPESALEHYEKAVERETQGNLGDSVSLYRKAFRLDSNIQEKYKAKHFPPALQTTLKPTNTSLPNAHASTQSTAQHPLNDTNIQSVAQLLDAFSTLDIASAPPETDLSEAPPCPIARLPEELLTLVLEEVGVGDVANLSRVSQVCKRFAYLVMTEESIWKTMSLSSIWGFGAMHYHYACSVKGTPFIDSPYDSPSDTELIPVYKDLTPTLYPTYRAQYRSRPRIRFNGCYISTVNYTRPGQASQSQVTWNSPVHIVTYYRYLRLFRDGTAIWLLTVTEPADVVHHLTKENLHKHHGALPSAFMKDALPGRWRLSGGFKLHGSHDLFVGGVKGPGEYIKEPVYEEMEETEEEEEEEEEGDLHVETEGVVPHYMYKIQFGLASAGRKAGTRNNKLVPKGYWNYNRLTDDWGEFGLKHDRQFYWSRVKSYV